MAPPAAPSRPAPEPPAGAPPPAGPSLPALPPGVGPNHKTLRQFMCRDLLWGDLEQLSRELECSVDYLINESIKGYVRLRRAREPQAAVSAPPPLSPPADSSLSPPHTAPPDAVRGADLATRVLDPHAGPPADLATRAPDHPVLPADPGAPPPRGPELTAIFEGKRYPITGDRFLIGRGKESCDLIIRDSNASRRHGLVERVGSQYFLVDLESVNGIEHEGRRVFRQQIAEGDVFSFCGCRVRFTFEKET